MDSLFSRNMENFNGNDQVNNTRSFSHRGYVSTYHMFSRECLKEILSTSDLDLSSYISYTREVLNPHFCSYYIIERLRNTQKKKCYRWETDEGLLEFIFLILTTRVQIK